MQKKKLADTLLEEAETCSGIPEKAAVLEQGFHILRELEENGQAKFQWRDKEGAQATDRAARSAAFCGKK